MLVSGYPYTDYAYFGSKAKNFALPNGNVSIVKAYALTEVFEDSKKDEFYNHQESIYDQLPEDDFKIVILDFNAKLGRSF